MSKKEKVVVGESSITAPQMKDFWIMVEKGLIDARVLTYVKEHIYEIRQAAQIPWWERILEKEKGYHQSFFGRKFNLSLFQIVLEKYRREKAERWQNFGLEPHFLPKVSMSQEDNYSGWKVKPEKWYYNQVTAEKILRHQSDGKLKAVKKVELEGIVVLIDTRLKPSYDNGRQMYENDNLLGPIIERLRKEGKIEDYNPRASRFCVSSKEWQEHVRPAFAKEFGFEINQVRLETVPEVNAIPQLYPHMPRHRDGRTNTWLWYEEYFGGASLRLCGGYSDYGDLSRVDCYSVGDHWNYRSLRPLVVL